MSGKQHPKRHSKSNQKKNVLGKSLWNELWTYKKDFFLLRRSLCSCSTISPTPQRASKVIKVYELLLDSSSNRFLQFLTPLKTFLSIAHFQTFFQSFCFARRTRIKVENPWKEMRWKLFDVYGGIIATFRLWSRRKQLNLFGSTFSTCFNKLWH